MRSPRSSSPTRSRGRACPRSNSTITGPASRRRRKRGSGSSRKSAPWAGACRTSMPEEAARLSAKLFADDIDQKPTRDGFGTGTVEAGKENGRVVVLCADLSESTRAEWFQKEFPDRFIEVGVAEQNMAALGGGRAAVDNVPFIASYAAFNPGRNYEQIRTTIALNEANVKVCGMHAGVSVGPDGATHQMLEDIGMMRMLPNMIVINP